MRTAKIVLMSLAFVFLLSTPALSQEREAPAAVDLTGQWEFESESPRGVRTTLFVFEQDGEKLTGHAEMGDQHVPLNGTVKGNAIEFTVTVTRGERSMQMRYTGAVDGETAQGTMETPRGASPWRARKLR